ncbi:MAG: acyl-CoA thioesterase [Planctomycetaceae bacterium]|jgi:acyl-CoA hydrolase|nr:acyl-CoA thioesterase [Planctomycetaceae bacterium]
MQTYKLVMPGDLNHYGFLFGGNLLKWVDEVAWIAATLHYPGMHFVTVAIDNVQFKKSIRQGSILRFECLLQRQGNTSVQFKVEVFRNSPEEVENAEVVFSTIVTMVRVDDRGQKVSLDAVVKP